MARLITNVPTTCALLQTTHYEKQLPARHRMGGADPNAAYRDGDAAAAALQAAAPDGVTLYEVHRLALPCADGCAAT